MKRRATTGGKVGKARRRKTQSRRTARVVARRGSSDANLREQLDQSRRERDDALEQQAATSEVLKVISSSPGELKPVFQSILANATRICEASLGSMVLCEGDDYRVVAQHGGPPAYAERQRAQPLIKRGPGTMLHEIATTKQPFHIADLLTRRELAPALARLGRARTLLMVPMLKDNEMIGAIGIYRHQVRPFTEKQIALVQNFAAQAVIAIENTRLLTELRQRTDDLSEALEQQTATSEVLGVISSSPGALQPVFDALLANATRICQASFGNMALCEGDGFRRVAMHNPPPAMADERQRYALIPRVAAITLDRTVRTKQVIHLADVAAEYPNSPLVRLGGAHTLLTVPILKEGEAIGVIGIYRQEVRPFTKKQIELVKSFAAQAVIAIENTRLLNELRQRTDDLSESLEQQTATSEVLKVISRSPGELEPVFQAMLENATRICGAKFGVLWSAEGDAFRAVALHGAPPSFVEERQRTPLFRPNPAMAMARAAASKQSVQIVDVAG